MKNHGKTMNIDEKSMNRCLGRGQDGAAEAAHGRLRGLEAGTRDEEPEAWH